MDKIILVGAREHNLKNVNLEIPKHQIIVFTGVSGSGKSSLAFNTIYGEAQRQLLETFSSFSRRFMPKIEKPKIEEIHNISTVIKIDQQRMGENVRSTVGTATEIYTYLRLLFSRCGDPQIGPSFYFSFNVPDGMCPDCDGLGSKISVDLDELLDLDRSIAGGGIRHPNYHPGGWFWKSLGESGLVDMDKPLKDFTPEEMNRLLYSEIIKVKASEHYGLRHVTFEGIVTGMRRRQLGKDDLQKRETKYFNVAPCEACDGSRLNKRALSVRIKGKSIAELSSMELVDLREFLETVSGPVADPLIRPMKDRLQHLIDMGVGYLSLDRPVSTLSGGESQRVKMARQLSCDLVSLIYVFDEPSIGLHPKDLAGLIGMLRKLCEKGNSVLVVEHDPGIIEYADHVIELGPGAGSLGGQITFTGSVEDLKRSDALTGKYLMARQSKQYHRRKPSGFIEIRDACLHNLKHVTVKIPTGVLVCITGVAGSGKSTLINDVFVPQQPDAIVVDQSPIGRNSRSNPATYTGVFDDIRRAFANKTGTSPNLFSFNSDGGCPKCGGSGILEVEMSFLDSIHITCDGCGGKRYTAEVLGYRYKDKDISEVLDMTVEDAMRFFTEHKILVKLKQLQQVGLGYLTLGQPLSTLSGGEAQRIKLASELHKYGSLYVMDEPTTGLHMADVERLMGIIDRLVEARNTVVVIEHNLDVIAKADWVIDLGPEGGKKGGEVVAEGTPEELAWCERSYTGRYLSKMLMTDR
ncbi:MAG TPA: excinuclease ABC subunit UvrA [Methanocella sp.]|nr:excinuclease ABC subunit UvrA [Methanocella sp.]